ncbi:MAG: IS66 family insertion sequence element accessory protein TnpA [Psychrobium sp.]
MASHKKITYWQSVFQSQRESGLTIVSFCQQNKIKLSTYYAWRKKVAEVGQAPKQKSHQLVPLFVSGLTTAQTSSLMIATPRGYQLTFDETMAIDKLQQILGLLE